jgi:hypothetical protein
MSELCGMHAFNIEHIITVVGFTPVFKRSVNQSCGISSFNIKRVINKLIYGQILDIPCIILLDEHFFVFRFLFLSGASSCS